MCLTIDSNVTINFNEDNEVIAYKVFYASGDRLLSFYQKKVATIIYNADRVEKNDKYVKNSVHVFLNDSEAASFLQNFSRFDIHTSILVKCICKKEDLVAAGIFNGYNSAAFTKVKLIPPDGYMTDGNCIKYIPLVY